jgi:hypothetical protein
MLPLPHDVQEWRMEAVPRETLLLLRLWLDVAASGHSPDTIPLLDSVAVPSLLCPSVHKVPTGGSAKSWEEAWVCIVGDRGATLGETVLGRGPVAGGVLLQPRACDSAEGVHTVPWESPTPHASRDI